MGSNNKLLKERSQLMRKLLRFREMLPGSFVERKLTCGKPNCICVREGKLHKAYQLTYRTEGINFSRMIPKARVEEVRKKSQLNKQFKTIVKRIQEINLELLNEKLDTKN